MTHRDREKAIVAMIQQDSFDEALMYKYLKEMCMATARTKNLFVDQGYYDDFATYMADKMYVRLIDKSKSLITNLISYLNLTIRGFFDVFSHQEFRQVIDTTKMTNGDEIRTGLESYFQDLCCRENKGLRLLLCEDYIKHLPTMLRDVLSDNRYSKQRAINTRLYTSVLISMIRGKETSFRLDCEEQDYFSLIYKRAKNKLGKELLETLHDDELSQDMITRMVSETGSCICSLVGEDTNGE